MVISQLSMTGRDVTSGMFPAGSRTNKQKAMKTIKKSVSVERFNRQLPGRTPTTQTPQERAALRQCRRQGLQPVVTTPGGEIIATRRGVMYLTLSEAPARLGRTTTQSALNFYRWLLDNCARVTTHEAGDDMGYRACVAMRHMVIGYAPAPAAQ